MGAGTSLALGATLMPALALGVGPPGPAPAQVGLRTPGLELTRVRVRPELDLVLELLADGAAARLRVTGLRDGVVRAEVDVALRTELDLSIPKDMCVSPEGRVALGYSDRLRWVDVDSGALTLGAAWGDQGAEALDLSDDCSRAAFVLADDASLWLRDLPGGPAVKLGLGPVDRVAAGTSLLQSVSVLGEAGALATWSESALVSVRGSAAVSWPLRAVAVVDGASPDGTQLYGTVMPPDADADDLGQPELVALDPATGDVRWSVPIHVPHDVASGGVGVCVSEELLDRGGRRQPRGARWRRSCGSRGA